MPRFAANLSLMYTEQPFLDRFEAAALDGFRAVEFLFPYEWPAAELQARLQHWGLQQVLFNAPPGGADYAAMQTAWASGERGTAALPGREAEFRTGMAYALHYAQQLGCPQVHVMAGILPAGMEREALKPLVVANLQWAAAEAAQYGITLLLEGINQRDMPRYFLNRQDHAHELIAAVGAPNLKAQMDLYHCQIVEGDVAMKLRKYLPTGSVAHIQMASVPERNEPDSGELHYPYLFELIDSLGYAGWVGCEYRPRRGTVPNATRDGLGWLAPWRPGAR
ncbi:MAG TPA: 2-oxo-tetronate isomerase [Burkholderiaceae bacterium]